MPDFVLEIGTEEVPAAAMVPALEQLNSLMGELLTRERIGFGEVRTQGTPRRLVAYVTGVAERQEDALLQHRGPARAVAFDAAGNPTRAAEGFARRYGLSAADLQVRQTETGEYAFAEQKVEGQPTTDVLAGALPGVLSSLSFPKFMRWGEGSHRFSRPVRWIVALLGSEVVATEACGVSAGRESFGHRFLPVRGEPGVYRVAVEGAETYFDRLRDAHIVADPAERRRLIQEQGNALAEADGVKVVWDPELLDEVTFVVEHPRAFMGRFSEDYLRLPRPVLVSAMRKHQRYFYLENPDGSLAPRFLAVRNGDETGLDIVRAGNERVLIFRFNDAVHHYNEDLKSTLAEKRERLKRVIFLEKLGTMWDKSVRLEAVVTRLCAQLGRADAADAARDAARLCKADLASNMVGELPELQGVMGREYALHEGLSVEVAQAIGEQYLPKAAGDALPPSLLGRLLALADRMDILTAAFSLGYVPTGSSDPFGLRRAAMGVVALLAELPAEVTLSSLVDRSLASFAGEAYYQAAKPRPADEVRANLLRFFRPRVEAVLEEAGTRLDLTEAVLGVGFDSIPTTLSRAAFLRAGAGGAGWEPVVQVATRIRNILKPTDGAPVAGNLAHLEHATEQRLAADVQARESALREKLAAGDWPGAWEEWTALCPAVDQFFVDVLVNAENPDLRAARQALLRKLDATFTQLADFSKIAGV